MTCNIHKYRYTLATAVGSMVVVGASFYNGMHPYGVLGICMIAAYAAAVVGLLEQPIKQETQYNAECP